MPRLNGRIAIVTGAGRGLGRAHAIRLAAEGASVVVNDIGVVSEGSDRESGIAQTVVAEIKQAGGAALASWHDVTDWREAADLVSFALSAFGGLHILVNNAGIVHTSPIVDMEYKDWDRVIRTHLAGHAGTTKFALRYWRSEAEAGRNPNGVVIHTSSPAAFFARQNLSHYDAAKAAIASFARTIALEGAPWGVRSNALLPLAHTRMWSDGQAPKFDAEHFERDDPDNVAPLVAWLSAEGCSATGQILYAYGESIWVLNPPQIAHVLPGNGRWTLRALDEELPSRLVPLADFEAVTADPAVPLRS